MSTNVTQHRFKVNTKSRSSLRHWGKSRKTRVEAEISMNVTKHTDKTIFRLLLFLDLAHCNSVNNRQYGNTSTCNTFNWTRRVEWRFFPGRTRYTIFVLWLHFCNTAHTSTHICTHPWIRYNQEQPSRKNSTSIDTFTHQEKYQLFVFTWSMATPVLSSLPNLAFSAYFQRRNPRTPHPPLYTASDIRHCARCRYTDEPSAPARRRKYRSSKQCFTRGCLESGVDQRGWKALGAGTAVCG